MKQKFRAETTSFSLHVMAMLFMLCDHLWGTIVPGADWLTCIGRLAFPIFAFMIVEGCFRTKNVKKYVPNVAMTTVSTTLTKEEEEECQKICDSIGVTYRIRPWED